MDSNWKHATPYGGVPPFAVVGGHDSDGSTIYVGRSFHSGDRLPGKVIPSKNYAAVPWGGSEVQVSTFEVLCGHGYRWVHCPSVHNIPHNAVVGGSTSTGEPLYVGRGHCEGSLTVGKIQRSHNCLYIPYGGHEKRLNTFEVLVQDVVAPPTMMESWVHAQGSFVPPGAVLAGHDLDGGSIYVGRAHHAGDLLPAKVVPNHGGAYVCHAGTETMVHSYEVLTGHGYGWTPAYGGNVPPGAVSAGRTSSDHKFMWVHSSPDAVLPPQAVLGGHESDGSPIYVGRSYHNGELLPAKVIPSKSVAYVCWQGQEIRKDHYEVLCGQSLSWTRCYGGNIPENAVTCGKDLMGQTLYIGRGCWGKALIVGKIHPVHRCLYVACEGSERRILSYEVLVCSEVGVGLFVPNPLASSIAGHVTPAEVKGSISTTASPASSGYSSIPGHITPAEVKGPTVPFVPPSPTAPVGGLSLPIAPILTTSPPAPSGHISTSGHITPAEVKGTTVPFVPVSGIVAPGVSTSLSPSTQCPPYPVEVKEPVVPYVPAPETYAAIASLGKVKPELPPPPPGLHVSTAPSVLSPQPMTSCPVSPPPPMYTTLFPPLPSPKTLPSIEEETKDLWSKVTADRRLPPDAVQAGYDADLTPVYVGRVQHEGSLLPAKAVPKKGCAFVTQNGRVITKINYEVLTGTGFKWIPDSDGKVPQDAVVGGRTDEGEMLYIGRAHHEGALTMGKIQPSHFCLYISHAGAELKLREYEVLVRRA